MSAPHVDQGVAEAIEVARERYTGARTIGLSHAESWKQAKAWAEWTLQIWGIGEWTPRHPKVMRFENGTPVMVEVEPPTYDLPATVLRLIEQDISMRGHPGD